MTAGLVVLTGGLSVAVAGEIPGRAAQPKVTPPDPFREPLTAYPPAGSLSATSAAPIAVAGAS